MRIQGNQKSETLPAILDRLKSEQDTRVIEHLDFEIVCDSSSELCTERGSHRADWLIQISCGHTHHWCNLRFMRHRSEAVINSDPESSWCTRCTAQGGGFLVWVSVTAWWPLRLGS